MSTDWLSALNHICIELLHTQSDAFVSFGLNVVVGLGVIRLVLFGIGCIFNAADNQSGMDWGGLTKHILVIGCATAMVRGYNVPVAGMSDSFPDLIMGGPLYLAHQIGDASYKQLDDVFRTVVANNPPSATLNLGLSLSQWTLELFIMLVRAVMLVVMSYGFVAVTVCVLVGPIFIPFLLIDPLSFMFWGWFKSFLQYSFYPVIGAAYAHIFSSLLVNMIDKATALELLLGILPLLAMTIVGMLHAPALCASLFNGSGGDHADMGGVGKLVVGK